MYLSINGLNEKWKRRQVIEAFAKVKLMCYVLVKNIRKGEVYGGVVILEKDCGQSEGVVWAGTEKGKRKEGHAILVSQKDRQEWMNLVWF